jgi:hypothetical protein
MVFLSLICVFFIFLEVLARHRQNPVACTGGILLFEDENPPGDDSDMKIAGATSAGENPEAAGNELETLRQNGDLDNARALSDELAIKIIDEDGGSLFGLDSCETDELRIQRRLLLAFTVIFCVDKIIVSRILGQVVVNRFYSRLEEKLPEFYQDIRSTGSFSFYYLCIRRGGAIEDCIGRSFAMLSGYEGNSVMEELGKALFLHFTDIVERSIRSCNFHLI